MTEDRQLFEALYCAITAAEAATQSVAALWWHLSPAEQVRWLEEAETSWPRRDIFLKTLLPAAEKIVADERAG
jgi:hypothetical protein